MQLTSVRYRFILDAFNPRSHMDAKEEVTAASVVIKDGQPLPAQKLANAKQLRLQPSAVPFVTVEPRIRRALAAPALSEPRTATARASVTSGQATLRAGSHLTRSIRRPFTRMAGLRASPTVHR